MRSTLLLTLLSILLISSFVRAESEEAAAAAVDCEDGVCCKNYLMVDDAYWDYLLLPVTLQDIIEKLEYTSDIFEWLAERLPPFEEIEDTMLDLHIGRMAEFNRIFLEETLEDFCERSGTLYASLVFDNLS